MKDGSEITENYGASYVPLIKGANRILDTLTSVWKYSLTALLLSLSIIGAISIVIFLLIPGREIFFTEGVIFLAIAAWIFARNFTGTCNECCTADIPRWKSILNSFVKSDSAVYDEKDGQSVIENLMRVVVATGDWIRLIKRDIFSVLFWPIIAILVFTLSVYQVDLFTVRITVLAFITYVFILTAAIYYGVNVKFRNWQNKATEFRVHTRTIETL